ncbi:amino acid adenylation domain-containing protein [Mucilaginibacter corticis]|uniref:Amino acid adenylation domain-containing protein n=1 Tax=Mucilaginibacter corticis TaxID=2597670 RepID=A0A556MTX0_9SPHI|nr:non-ribosomal peptide synthetase [Mucilaginibacter corticis]TSJ43396.1 amino acid adenylation domain-containing protein [Mucilaginibacter corticis]
MALRSDARNPEYYNPEHGSIHELIRWQSHKSPYTIAIKHNADSITYSNLEVSTNQINALLQDKGIAFGDVVAVAMDRSIHMAVCLLAIMKAGATYLPIDPNLPVERIAYLLEDSSAKKVIVSEKYRDLINHNSSQIIFEDAWLNRGDYPEDFVPVETGEDDLIYIIYTSGSTGHPKGVGVSHKGLINLLKYRLHSPGMDANDNVLGLTTMSFDIAQEELYLPLICGALLTIVDKEITRDGSALLEIVKNQQITLMQATPYIWQMMLESGWDTPLPIKAFCGGEAMTNELAGKLLGRCREVWNMYGPTETTICTTVKKITDSNEPITIGKPIDNTGVYILDEHLNKVMPGAEGELYICGVGVTKGYINREELTAEKFIDDKFSPVSGRKMYKTGDLGRLLKNGEIQFIGRVDNQIKLRGYRIEKEEIEYQLKQQENIKDALVTVYEDSVKNARLIAYLTLKTSDSDTASIINNCREGLKKVLPEHMVPTNYEILTEIPLLPSGKVDVKSLPKPNIQETTQDFVAPTNRIEKMLAEIWEEYIGIKNIGITDDFFELGGTSMIAVKTKIKIEKITNKRLSPSVLFQYPTIQQLALAIDDFTEDNYHSLVPIQPVGSKIPMYIVHGIGLNVLNFRTLATDLGPDQPIYGLQGVSLGGQQESLNTIEKTAEFYNAEIIKQNPTGPYVIAGYSIGGVIAYEMVKQLKAAGKDVKLLIMFDTAIQIPTHQYPLLKKIWAKSMRQLPKLKFRIASFLKQPKENIDYIKAVYGKKFAKGFYHKHETYGLPDYMQQTIFRLKNAFDQYVIVPYDVKIDLFSGNKLYYLDDPEFLGWRKYALQGVNVYPVSSSHNTMFDAPYHQELANLLKKRLDEINS